MGQTAEVDQFIAQAQDLVLVALTQLFDGKVVQAGFFVYERNTLLGAFNGAHGVFVALAHERTAVTAWVERLCGDDLVGAGEHKLIKGQDRKSTRLNSSHVAISYAAFCLK